MSITAKEVIRKLIKESNFTSTEEVMAAIKDMFKDVLQEVMEAELETELGYEKQERRSNNVNEQMSKNYRNGYSKKTVRTQLGKVSLNVPRDRNGEYEPQIIKKHSRTADGMDEKIIALYSSGLSIADISEQIRNLYDVEISPELVSKITDKIMPQVSEWKNRPLEEKYPFVFMDAIHIPITSFVPSNFTPMAIYTAFFITALSCLTL